MAARPNRMYQTIDAEPQTCPWPVIRPPQINKQTPKQIPKQTNRREKNQNGPRTLFTNFDAIQISNQNAPILENFEKNIYKLWTWVYEIFRFYGAIVIGGKIQKYVLIIRIKQKITL